MGHRRAVGRGCRKGRVQSVPNRNVYKEVSGPFPAFRDRHEAGRKLADFVSPGPRDRSIVLALPRGGVPVGGPLADQLGAPLDLVMVRKLPVPASPEAGFGAVAADGSRILNERMVKYFSLSRSEIESITNRVLEEVRSRATKYRHGDVSLDVEDMDAFLVDDGLATGYTMMAAAKMVRQLEPRSLTLAVPVSPWDSVLTVEDYFDEIHILYVQEFPPFAVASFYEDFHDLSDDEVREILRRGRTTLTPERRTNH